MENYTTTQSLHDGHERWLAAPHAKLLGKTNAERKVNDLKNHERALRCYAAAAGDGETELAKLPLSLLQVSDALLARRVREGARLLAEGSGKQVPSDKTLSNLISCLKAIRRVALEGVSERQSVTDVLAGRKRQKVSNRPIFRTSDWPETFRIDWEAYVVWKTSPFIPTAEEQFRPNRAKAVSLYAYRRQLNMYIGYLVRDCGMADLILEDLCDPDNYVRYLGWYLSPDATSGYHTARDTGIALAGVSKYLVAKGRIDEDTADGRKIWEVIYAHARKALRLGAERGLLREKEGLGSWCPKDLVTLAKASWDSEPVHSATPHGRRHRLQLVCRKRSAVIFRLGVETPLRIRNWGEMRWGQNLYKNAKGKWEVHFKGEELKVSRRGPRTNVYKHTYSDDACEWIERWRAELRLFLGDDFETLCPYVFPSGDFHNRPCHLDALRRSLRGLSLEILGREFHPHLIRSIVASNVINELGGDGLGLAAELLGDTVEEVMKTYYRPNTKDAMRRYLATLLED